MYYKTQTDHSRLSVIQWVLLWLALAVALLGGGVVAQDAEARGAYVCTAVDGKPHTCTKE